MSGNNRPKVRLLVLIMIPFIIVMSGCAAKNKNISSADAGLILKYNMPKDQVLKYRLSSKFAQNLDIRGQSVEITSDETRLFSVKSKGEEKDKYKIGVEIDSMNILLATPQGEISPDLSGLKGKGFDFSLSSLGQETDLPEAKSLEYELIQGQKQNVVTGFQALFPNLPMRPLKIGDTWISKDTVNEETVRGELHLYFESKNRLEGFETVNGMKCAKIIGDVVGRLDGRGEELGMDLISKAKIEGTDTWYFAYEEGIFVKMTSSGVAKGIITGSGSEKIEIPMKREYTIETRLID